MGDGLTGTGKPIVGTHQGRGSNGKLVQLALMVLIGSQYGEGCTCLAMLVVVVVGGVHDLLEERHVVTKGDGKPKKIKWENDQGAERVGGV
jgi:hypothetical protein